MPIPIGLNLTSIGVDVAWWLESARRAEEAGFESVWIWDHFISRGRLDAPVLECWSMLAAVSVTTSRIRLGSFVSNVMNRHPAVLARIVATTSELSGGRLDLGIGAGGHPDEHQAYGLAFPPRGQRAEHLEEAVTILRMLLAGGPADFAGRHYRLRAAHAFPVPRPRPRIVLAGTTPAGARRAARRGDAWTCFGDHYDELLPAFESALAEAGRGRDEVAVLVAIEVDEIGDDLANLAARWQARGASELIVHAVRPDGLDRLLTLARARS